MLLQAAQPASDKCASLSATPRTVTGDEWLLSEDALKSAMTKTTPLLAFSLPALLSELV
jgi:hypothetical protein